MRVTASRIGFLVVSLLTACGVADSASGLAARKSVATGDPGALVRMEMDSTVGVLLDEIPAGPLREQAAAEALAQPAAFWTSRAQRQVRLTYYRLVFRQFYYPGAWSQDPHKKGPLPLPPKEIWNIALAGPAHRATVAGHDLVVADYRFTTHILADPDSPAVVEPRLASVGGTWDEPFTLPIDPELLLERTGFACMDENEYPLNSVFEENTSYFYDQTCRVETPNTRSCHLTTLPSESCSEALTRHVGPVRTNMHFTRVAWNLDIADTVRVGTITNPTGADLRVVAQAMEEERRIFYRFFAPGSCEFDEGVIGYPGWRRLLTFSAVVSNDGTKPIHIGDVFDPTNPWVLSHVFEFSQCHGHYHFSHYGDFNYNGAPGSKRAFCLEDTNRFHNDETTPLTAAHQTCAFQGIGAGWGDEYEFGLPGQWVDITDVGAGSPHDLTFLVNPDQFLCEGQTLGADYLPVDPTDLSSLVFDTTSFTDPAGNHLSRVRCAFPSTWNTNNLGAVSVVSPTGSFVTEPCTRGQTGPLRSCGFTALSPLQSATAGSTVRLRCTTTGSAQVLRVCERSEALGVGVACTLADAAANVVVAPGNATRFSFQSPAVRDTVVPGTGGYSLYQAPVLPSQAVAPVVCTPF